MDDNQQTTTLPGYDETPYPSQPHFQTHPNQLSTIAIIFGLKPTPVTNCRVLELGCGSAMNLISMAAGLPESQFLGVDLAKQEVELAHETLRALDLKNIEIRHASLTDLNRKNDGEFDYIIAHGVYSWVPPAVRKKMLTIIRELLSKNGIAYISFNTYPGWSTYKMVRDMMMYHTRDIRGVNNAIKEGRSFIYKLAGMIPASVETYYPITLKTISEIFDPLPANYFRHDMMAEYNEPFYFYEFVEHTAAEKLQYLAEAEFQRTTSANLSPQAAKLLQDPALTVVQKEQYADFLFNRPFRTSLLVHDELQIERTINLNNILQFYVAAQLMSDQSAVDVHSKDRGTFLALEGNQISTSDRLAKSLWKYLAGLWPVPVNFSRILEYIKREFESGTEEERQLISDKNFPLHVAFHVFTGFTYGLVKLFMHPLPITVDVSEYPTVTPLVRYQAAQGFWGAYNEKEREHKYLWVTNQLHDFTKIDNFQHHVLPCLDGKHDRAAIVDRLIALTKEGKINLQRGGGLITDPSELRPLLRDYLEKSLQYFASSALLIA